MIEGTRLRDGDSVSHETLDKLSHAREKRQRLAACYAAGQINQGRIAGEYPPPDVEDLSKIGSQEIAHITRTGTVTGRFTHTEPPFREMKPWPGAYATGPRKLTPEDVQTLASITPGQARDALKAIVGADYAELERRVAAWHAEMCEDLKALGFKPAGDGPLSDTWIKEGTDA